MDQAPDPRSPLRLLGPGLLIAATGVGAGDLLAAMLAGAGFGYTLAWVVVLGALLKLALNEGVARWQLATGTTLLEGWCHHLGRLFQLYFLLYLVLWSFIVAGGLMSACGVAGHAVIPALGIRSWAMLQSMLALGLVLIGGYKVFERVMQVLIAVMVVTLLFSAGLLLHDPTAALRGLAIPVLPAGSAATALSLMGGVGGSVTLLSYGYWIRERGWRGGQSLTRVRQDLGLGYVLTAAFGVAMVCLAAAVLGAAGAGMPPGSNGLVACGDAIRNAASARFGDGLGATTAMIFLVGVWGAVFTSTFGVWQGVPYLFADYLQTMRGHSEREVDPRSNAYRGFLLFLAVPPAVLLFLDRPIWVIKVYTLTGGLFMPVLAGSLLWLNSRTELVGKHRNGPLSTGALILALLLFAAIGLRQIIDLLG